MLGVPRLAALIQINPPSGACLHPLFYNKCAAGRKWNDREPNLRKRAIFAIESRKRAIFAAILSGAFLASLQQARAIDLTGPWATSAEECKNVFVRKGKANQIAFAPMSEVHGGGFIVEPNRLIGRTAKCTIKAKKDDGQTVNIVASCATDIMLSSVQFELNVVNQDKVRRLFPGMEDMETLYYRCQI